MARPFIPSKNIHKFLIFANVIIAIIYLSWWFLPKNSANPYLYGLLLFGEIYHVAMALVFWFTIYPSKRSFTPFKEDPAFTPFVDIYITVAGEPVDVIQKTIEAAKQIDYPHFNIYILNDSFIAGKDNWKAIEKLAKELDVQCITRQKPGGAKAGNLNHALVRTNGELIAVLDTDMIPHADFLAKLVPYFKDQKLGFVQSPQYYTNRNFNDVTAGAWEQQELFFGSILKGKNRDNAAFICGTNFLARRKALESIGGFNTDSIAEDILTSLLIHQKGWHSQYTDEVLCEGLGPEDLLSYYKQQRRWAFGSLILLFRHNPIFKTGLTWRQKLHYLSSVLFYLNGIVVAIDIIMPLLYFYFGLRPVSATTTSFALFFIPYIFVILYTLYLASGRSITFRALAFSQSGWFLHIQAFFENLINRSVGFEVTPKKALQGNFIWLAMPHIIYIVLGTIGVFVALFREGLNASILTNIAWFIFNSCMFFAFIKTAYPWHEFLGTNTAVAIETNS